MNSLEWFQFLVSFALQASVLTGVACAWEQRCQTASVKTRIWTCYYVSLLSVLTAGLLLPRLCWAAPWRGLPANHLLTVVRVEQVAGSFLLVAWLTGAAILMLRWAANFLRLKRLLQHCPVVDAAEHARLRSLLPNDILGTQGQPVEFRVVSDELGPFCYQLHRPVVFLPPSLLRADNCELKHVLQHELEHLRTQHPLQVFVQRLVQTVLWHLPVVWLAGRRANLAREFVCDDAATTEEASTVSYLKTLLCFAQRNATCQGALLAIARSPSELNVRARRLASHRQRNDNRFGKTAPLCIVLAAMVASQIWLPTNPLASANSYISPWPEWSAAALHAFDFPARDFDRYDAQLQVHDLVKSRESRPSSR